MTKLAEITVQSKQKDHWIDISSDVKKIITESGITEGICVVFVPHTTAALTVNENADPNVPHDLNLALTDISPDRPDFRHDEGNSAAHVKTSLMGPSLTLIVSKGALHLGTWQGIWFFEFDGPRKRKVFIRVLGE